MAITVISTEKPSGNLTTISRFKKDIKSISTSTDTDDYIKNLITEASDYISHECNRTFQKQQYSETCGGSGRSTLILTKIPIVSIESVYYLGNEVLSSSYEIEDSNSGVIFNYSGWNDTSFIIENIEPMMATEKSPDYTVDYTAGWVLPSTSTGAEERTLPYDIERACLDYMKISWYDRKNPMVKTQKTGDASETKFSITDFVNTNVYSPSYLPPNIERIIKKYRLEY